jgi:hypothetical protein
MISRTENKVREERAMPKKEMIFNLGLAAALLLLAAGTPTKNGPGACDKNRAPNKVEGQVSHIDKDQQVLEVRKADGTTIEFRVAPETLKQYAVGDHIQATLRSAPGCESSAS